MANKHLIKQPTDIVLERLSVYFEKLNSLYQNNNITDTELVGAYQEALDKFLGSIDGSSVDDLFNILPGTPANPIEYNNVFVNLVDDIKGIYFQLRALDLLSVSTFNSVISEHNQIQQFIKKIGNSLGDYLLYSDQTIGGGYFFGDSFSSSDKLDIGSSLISEDECFVSYEEGVVLLPLDGSPERPDLSITINSNSNGIVGNNFQIDAPSGHDAIEAILDNEPNTWFEYEKVVSSYSDIPLVLDFTFTLKEEKIINHIHINPVNFGTPTPIKIKLIETSKDGKEYMSIKDEIPIKDFVPEEEDNIFELNAASSKYSGQGFYSFMPRKTKYIHIRFEQTTPYPIQTNNGTRLRYAIGIRDINIFSRKFKSKGSLVSSNFNSQNEIKKVSMWASENPAQSSTLSDISHFISHDDGSTWTQIQPQKRFENNILEVVDFNTISPASISTENPVNTLRHKIEMERFKDAFSGNVTLKQEKIFNSDIVNIPSVASDTIYTTEEPIKESVNIVAPFYGSFSCPRAKNKISGESPPMELDFVDFKVDSPNSGTLRFKLPFFGIEDLEEKIRVFVNGEQIEYARKDESVFSYLSEKVLNDSDEVDENSKVYFLNKDGMELQFGWTGNTGTQRGFVPSAGSKISVCLDGDNPTLELTEQGYILSLSAPSDGIEDNIHIIGIDTFDDNEAVDHEIIIPAGFSKYVDPHLGQLGLSKASYTLNKQVGTSLFDNSKKKNVSVPSIVSFESGVKNIRQDVLLKATYQTKYIGDNYYYSAGGHTGIIPPIFLEGNNNFEIKQYDLDGNLIDSEFTDKVSFVDGDSELRNNLGEKVPTRYTFDPKTGTVYMGAAPSNDRRTVLVCKTKKASIVSSDMWDFEKEIGTGKTNTRKIILDPKAVFSKKVIYQHDNSSAVNSIPLLGDNYSNEHSWTKKRIIKKTVKIDNSIFPKNSKPLEVPFVNGSSEFLNIQKVSKEDISFVTAGTNLYSFVLQQIDSNKKLVGSLLFGTSRSSSSATLEPSKFVTQVTTTPESEGEWRLEVAGSTATVTLYTESEPSAHFVSYSFKSFDSGLDSSSLYSIDYKNAVIHFSDSIFNSGNIAFEVSMYSAFYNISKEIEPRFVEKIDPVAKTIKFKSSYILNTVKLDTALTARPQFFIILYDYYKKSSESLRDIEPYFSPICKEIAFKSVTSDVLEEL